MRGHGKYIVHLRSQHVPLAVILKSLVQIININNVYDRCSLSLITIYCAAETHVFNCIDTKSHKQTCLRTVFLMPMKYMLQLLIYQKFFVFVFSLEIQMASVETKQKTMIYFLKSAEDDQDCGTRASLCFTGGPSLGSSSRSHQTSEGCF